MPILDFGRKSPAERKLDEIRTQIGRLDVDVDMDEVRKRLKQVHLPEVDTDRLQKRVKQVHLPEVDTDRVQRRLKDVHVPGRYEEPESSSAGFVAGIAVGIVLGIVLSYLFGKGRSSGAMDTFTSTAWHQADELKAAQALDDDPAIEREIDGEGDTFVEVDEPRLDATDQTPRTT